MYVAKRNADGEPVVIEATRVPGGGVPEAALQEPAPRKAPDGPA
jgi:hypothetical protein